MTKHGQAMIYNTIHRKLKIKQLKRQEKNPKNPPKKLRSTLSYPNETSKECIQFGSFIGVWKRWPKYIFNEVR